MNTQLAGMVAVGLMMISLLALGVRPLCLVIVLQVKGLRYHGGAKRPQAAANLAFWVISFSADRLLP